MATSFSFGSAHEFYGLDAAEQNNVACLNGGECIVSYQAGATNGVTLNAGFMGGGTDITWGPMREPNAGHTHSTSAIAMLNSSQAIVAFGWTASSARAVVAYISGTTVTLGAAVEFHACRMQGKPTVGILDDSHFVVTYRNASGDGHPNAVVGHVDGTTISFGAVRDLTGTNCENATCAVVDSSTVVFAVVPKTDFHGDAYVGTISGVDITLGSSHEFTANTPHSSAFRMCALDSDKVVIVYRDIDDSGHGTAIIGHVTGTTLSFGSEYEFTTNTLGNYLGVSPVNSSQFVVVYDDATAGDVTAVLGTQSGVTISFESTTDVVDSGQTNSDVCIIPYTADMIVVFRQNGSGLAKYGELTGVTPFPAPTTTTTTTTTSPPAVPLLLAPNKCGNRMNLIGGRQ